MKKLENKSNVNPADATWPFGEMRDRTVGGVQGTPMNTEFFTDYVQTFEKFMSESGIVANGLPDNAVNGFQLFDAMRIAVKGYKSYIATLTQTGTNAPVANVILNELGETLTWVRAISGVYGVNTSGVFTIGKTVAFISAEEDSIMYIKSVNDNSLNVYTYDLPYANTDGLLLNTSIEIRVYL